MINFQPRADLSAEKRALLDVLLKEGGVGSTAVHSIPRRTGEGHAPLSYSQQRLWFLDRLSPASGSYNLPAAIPLRQAVDVAALERSLNALVTRHEILRTRFTLRAGEPMQEVQSSLTIPLPVVDLQHVPADERDAALRAHAEAEARRPFALAEGPLLRTTLLQLGPADFVFLVTLHHIVADGWSMDVLSRELGTLYEAAVRGQAVVLPALPIQFADYAVWQRGWLKGEVLERQLAYWQRQLTDLPVLRMPTDHPRPAVQTFRGAHERVTFGPAVTAAVRQLSQREGATLFMTLLAGFVAVLSRYTSQDDIVVGSAIANRTRPEVEGLIGFFVNTLVLRVDTKGDPSFAELLQRVRGVALGAFANQDVPFEKLVETLHPERDLSRNPLCQIAFQLLNASTPPDRGRVRGVGSLQIEQGTASLDLVVTMRDQGAQLTALLEYSTELFEVATIRRFASHFETVLGAAAAEPARRLSELPMLSDVEQAMVVREWNRSDADYGPARTVHAMFEEQAAQRPDAIAIDFGGELWTYRALDRAANHVAAVVRRLGVGPEVLVAICMERSPSMIAAVLGVLKAGGAYVPLDPAYPKDRLAFMLADCDAPVVLTDRALVAGLPPHRAHVVCIDDEQAGMREGRDDAPANGAAAANLAYVIYTSGSTGRPKGGLVEHRGLANLAFAQRQLFGVNGAARVLQFCSLSFDGAFFEVLLSLASGGALCVGTRDGLIPGPDLIDLLRERQVNIALFPPSALAALPDADLPGFSTITVAGEPCTADLVARWAHGRRFFNLYGPTEGSILASVAACRPDGRAPTIGRPIGNAKLYVLDRFMNPCPPGVPGELYIGGAGVGRGYLGRPGLTAERFVPDPFGGEAGARLYKTGDLGKHLPDGQLVFLGRTDHQVKIRGFRVELREIEVVLEEHAAVRECVVLAPEEVSGGKQLVGYVVASAPVSPAELQEHLRARLPEHMVPIAIVILEAMPLSPNGKIDRRRLPSWTPSAQPRVDYMPPENDVERTIAEVWKEVLQLDTVGRDDNFFDLGGHSLLVARVHGRLVEVLRRDVSMIDLFQYPTISALARHLAGNDANQRDRAIQRVKERAERQKHARRRHVESVRRAVSHG